MLSEFEQNVRELCAEYEGNNQKRAQGALCTLTGTGGVLGHIYILESGVLLAVSLVTIAVGLYKFVSTTRTVDIAYELAQKEKWYQKEFQQDPDIATVARLERRMRSIRHFPRLRNALFERRLSKLMHAVKPWRPQKPAATPNP